MALYHLTKRVFVKYGRYECTELKHPRQESSVQFLEQGRVYKNSLMATQNEWEHHFLLTFC